MENNTEKQANDAAQNYLKEIYAGHNDDYSRDMIKILEDLREGQDWGYDWFTPNEFIYFLSEEHKYMLLKHGVDKDDLYDVVFCFYDGIILKLNKKMLDWLKSQYEAGNIGKGYYVEEICNIIHKDFDVPLDTPEEIDEFINDSSDGEYFREYLLGI